MSNSLSQVIENCSQKNLLNFLDIWLLIEIFFVHKAPMFVIKNLTTKYPTVTEFATINNQIVHSCIRICIAMFQFTRFVFLGIKTMNFDFWTSI